jgi:hypothetical protein
MNMSKSFLEYFVDIDRIFGKYYLAHALLQNVGAIH